MAKPKKAVPAATVSATAPESVTSAPAGEETQAPLEPVQLTIADLQLLSRIVDLASRRGAFQAGELSQVGDAFNKLTSFLAYVESVQAPAAATDTPAEAAEAATATATATAE
jgi:hypothetical protein